MSKAAKKRKQAVRRQQKAARKAAKAAMYKSFSEQGINNKTRRHKAKSTEPSGKKGQHAMTNCGNTGCIKCHPELNNVRMCNGKYRQPDNPIKRS